MTETESGATAARKDEREKRGNIFSRIALFLRQVVSELRKVIWPGRSDLAQFTIVVIIFLLVMVGIVAALDYVFAQGVLALFG